MDRLLWGLIPAASWWACRPERSTTPGRARSPGARLDALANLQRAGVPTYAMLCPIFPNMLDGGGVEDLVDRCNPAVVEHVWAEPYNDRSNWKVVRSGYPARSFGYRWFTRAFEDKEAGLWSDYATAVYARLHAKAAAEGWTSKLRFLLYEDGVQPEHVGRLGTLEGVLLQSKPGSDGCSRNPNIATIQR